MLLALRLLLQVLIAFGLLLCAIRVLAALRRQQAKSWDEIMCCLTSCDLRLPQLSYHPVFSAGLECPKGEIFARIGGCRGLVAMFRNIGTMLGALEYMETTCAPSASFLGTIEHLRSRAVRVRMMIFVGCGQLSLPGYLRLPSLGVARVAEAYVEFISEMSLAISDYRPDLLPQYIRSLSTN